MKNWVFQFQVQLLTLRSSSHESGKLVGYAASDGVSPVGVLLRPMGGQFVLFRGLE